MNACPACGDLTPMDVCSCGCAVTPAGVAAVGVQRGSASRAAARLDARLARERVRCAASGGIEGADATSAPSAAPRSGSTVASAGGPPDSRQPPQGKDGV